MSETDVQAGGQTVQGSIEFRSFSFQFPEEPLRINGEDYQFLPDTERIAKAARTATHHIRPAELALSGLSVSYEEPTNQLSPLRRANQIYNVKDGHLALSLPRSLTSHKYEADDIARTAEKALGEQLLRGLVVHNRLHYTVARRMWLLGAGALAGAMAGEQFNYLEYASHQNHVAEAFASTGFAIMGMLGGVTASGVIMSRGSMIGLTDALTKKGIKVNEKVARKGPSQNSSVELKLKNYFESPLIFLQPTS